MAKFYVREWAGCSGFNGGMPILQGLVCEQPLLTFTGGHQESVAFQPQTKFVEWSTDAICSWTIIPANDQSSMIATVNGVRYPANAAGIVGVSGGQKIGVILNT